MSSSEKLLSIEKFDGTNWETWSFAIKAALMYINALDIAEKKELCPGLVTVTAADGSTSDNQKEIDDWSKRARQGNALILTSVKPTIYQSLDTSKSLTDNWKALKDKYGTRTGLNLWVDYHKYTTTHFSTSVPLTQQIDEMSELQARIVAGGLPISDALHALNILQALPDSYEVVQQSILAGITDFATVKSDSIRTRILSEELRQGTSANVSAIRSGKSKASPESECHWCGGKGHFVADCRRKARGLSQSAAKADLKKSINRRNKEKDKGKKKEENKDAPSVSAITNDPPDTTPPPTSVPSASNTISFCFYIASETKWMLDSGCSDHFTADVSDYADYTAFPTPKSLKLADGRTTIKYYGTGTVHGTTMVHGREQAITLPNVLYSPDLGGRFISIRCLSTKGISTLFRGTTATIEKDGTTYGVGDLMGQQYWLSLRSSGPSIHSVTSVQQTPIETLHNRLGHLSWSTLRKLKDHIDPASKRALATCEGCLLGKSKRRSYKTSHTRHSKPFSLVHMDLCGPMKTQSIQGNSYFFLIVDDATRYRWTYFIRHKSQTFECFKHFHALITNKFEAQIKIARSDRGGEFLSKEFDDYLAEKGIERQLTAPDTPQQNGVAERSNGVLVGSAKAMLHAAGMSYGFWECAIATAVHARNRSPARPNDYVSPHERLLGRAPDLSYLRTFGCLAYRNIPSTSRTKLDPSAEQLTFVGYDGSTKGYKLWNPKTRKFIVSSDVVFEETVFPLRTQTPPTQPPNQPLPSTPELVDLPLPDSDDEGDDEQPPLQPPVVPPPVPELPPEALQPPPGAPQPFPQADQPPPPPDIHMPPGTPPRQRRDATPGPSRLPQPRSRAPSPSPSPEPEQPLRRTTRQGAGARPTDPASVYKDQQAVRRAADRRRQGFPRIGNIWTNSIEAYIGAMATTPLGDPNTYEYALSSPLAHEWQKAMEEELRSHAENGTWELVDLPAGRQTVKNKWVYLTKRDTAGNPTRYKARLVAKGFTQVHGVDYEETFAPVARLDSLRLLLALAAVFDWDVHQIDIKTAYLNGELDEEIYMDQPKGFTAPGMKGKVCRLRKAIYGLKQAGRQWHKHLRDTLLEFGFGELLSGDVSIFFMRLDGGDTLIILVYVDDMALFGSLPAIKHFKDLIGTRYKYTDMGEIEQFLGLHIHRDRTKKTITINQLRYIRTVIERFDMDNCRPSLTPMVHGTKLIANPSPNSDSQRTSRYQSMVGSLMYAMLGSRPDLSFAINKLSQFGANPTEEHLLAAQHALQYLRTTEDLQLTYGISDSTDFHGYTDSDWASDPNDRRSTTGYAFFLAGGTIAWASRKQRSTALSSTEAEYMALTEASQHALWTTHLLHQLGFEIDLPVQIYCDSKGARDIAANNVFHKRTKHIDIKHHFVRELIANETVSVLPVESENNLADVLTKALPKGQHMRLAQLLGLAGDSIMGEC